MMNNAVKERGCDFSVGEDVVPMSKFEVRGDDDGFALITFGDNLKQEFRTVGINGHIPPFVADKQIKFVELFHKK